MCGFVQVVFINDQTGEYQYYEIQFRAVRPGVMAIIKLSTTVRQRKQHTLTLENPLTTAVSFTATCNSSDIQLPAHMSVPAQSEVHYHLFIHLFDSGSRTHNNNIGNESVRKHLTQCWFYSTGHFQCNVLFKFYF